MSDLTDIDSVGGDTADRLRDAGFDSVDDVATATVDDLATVSGIGTQSARTISENAGQLADSGDDQIDDDTGGDNGDEPERFPVELDLGTVQRDHTIAALLDEEVAMRRRNRSETVDSIRDIRDRLDEGDDLDLTLNQLGIFYRALARRVDEYRSDTLSDLADDLAEVRDSVREHRVEHWPQ